MKKKNLYDTNTILNKLKSEEKDIKYLEKLINEARLHNDLNACLVIKEDNYGIKFAFDIKQKIIKKILEIILYSAEESKNLYSDMLEKCNDNMTYYYKFNEEWRLSKIFDGNPSCIHAWSFGGSSSKGNVYICEECGAVKKDSTIE